jgi:hypothetical protein
VKVYGLYYVAQQPKNDPLIREIKEAIENISTRRQVSSDDATLAGSETASDEQDNKIKVHTMLSK